MIGALGHNRMAAAGLLVLVVVSAGAIVGPWAMPYGPFQQSLEQRLMPAFRCGGAGPCHVAGTDQLGRDLLARILLGARISLLVGVLAVAISALLGTALGVAAGYWGGRLDRAIALLGNAQMAMPSIVLAIAVMAIIGPEIGNLIVVLGVTGWVGYARVVRASVLTIRDQEYVLAARSLGASTLRIAVSHVLRNAIEVVPIIASGQLATVILAEASLSFLGLGVPPPAPTWGNMLADGRDYLASAWWLATFPGVALTVTAAAINLVGDGLRDRLAAE